MRKHFTRRPSPALAVAFAALFVSLGGVSYGVATGSIDSREIKNNSVRGQDIRDNTVQAAELRRRSLDGTDIKIERVGGDAVKEQVLETEKLARVPRAENADNLASAPPAAYRTRWALVNEAGQIERQTGGFKTVNCYQANDNCYIDTGEDVTDNGVSAQIAVGNVDGSNILSAETGAAPCFLTSVACGPPGTDTNNGGNNGVLVVAPRDSDGSDFQDPGDTDVAGAPNAAQAARFYVFVTDSSGQ